MATGTPAAEPGGVKSPADLGATPRGLRFVFVQMLFALTMGEIARQLAGLVAQIGLRDAPSAYSHLILAVVLVATSWLGWTRSKAPGNERPVINVFELPFLVLLLDLALVVCYFIIVRSVELPAAAPQGRITPPVPTADAELGWVLVVFCGFFLWDFLTKALMGGGAGKFWSRGKLSLLCVALAAAAWWLLRGGDGVARVVWADVTLIALIFFFRALKQYQSAREAHLTQSPAPEGAGTTGILAWTVVAAVAYAAAFLMAALNR